MGNGRAIIIRGGRVLDSARPEAELADLLIQRDTIRDIGPPGLAAPEDAVLIDAADKLLHPGLINAHTHGYHAAHKATTDRWTLERFLAASPWVNADLSLEASYLSTKIAALEMVLKGCTACYDLPLPMPLPTLGSLQAVAQAYIDVGMRAVIAPMVANISIFHAIPGSSMRCRLRYAATWRLAKGHPSTSSSGTRRPFFRNGSRRAIWFAWPFLPPSPTTAPQRSSKGWRHWLGNMMPACTPTSPNQRCRP